LHADPFPLQLERREACRRAGSVVGLVKILLKRRFDFDTENLLVGLRKTLAILRVVGLGRGIVALREDMVDAGRPQSICRRARLEARYEYRRDEHA
jgi:hypothetical protein